MSAPEGATCSKCRHLTLDTERDEFTCAKGGPLEPCDKFKDASKPRQDVQCGISQIYRAGWGR